MSAVLRGDSGEGEETAMNDRGVQCEPLDVFNDDLLGELSGVFERDEPTCRGCGCTQSRPCEGGCVWATADLCSRCVT